MCRPVCDHVCYRCVSMCVEACAYLCAYEIMGCKDRVKLRVHAQNSQDLHKNPARTYFFLKSVWQKGTDLSGKKMVALKLNLYSHACRGWAVILRKLERNGWKYLKSNPGWNGKPSVKAFRGLFKNTTPEHLNSPFFIGRAMNMPILRVMLSFSSLRSESVTAQRMFVPLTAACAEGREEVERGADRQGLILHFHHRPIPS